MHTTFVKIPASLEQSGEKQLEPRPVRLGRGLLNQTLIVQRAPAACSGGLYSLIQSLWAT